MSYFDIREKFAVGPDGEKVVVSRRIKIKIVNRMKILELIGRHVSVQAFRNTVPDELENALKEFASSISRKSIQPTR